MCVVVFILDLESIFYFKSIKSFKQSSDDKYSLSTLIEGTTPLKMNKLKLKKREREKERFRYSLISMTQSKSE
jgi:hypothetical protein